MRVHSHCSCVLALLEHTHACSGQERRCCCILLPFLFFLSLSPTLLLPLSDMLGRDIQASAAVCATQTSAGEGGSDAEALAVAPALQRGRSPPRAGGSGGRRARLGCSHLTTGARAGLMWGMITHLAPSRPGSP